MILGHEQIAAFILRIVLGVTLVHFAWRKIQHRGQSSGSNTVAYGYIELLVGICLVVGFFTQLAAFLNFLILVIKIAAKAKEGKLLSDGINYYILLWAMAAALLFVGPGIWAIDSLI